jgi:hypothetical protein
VVQKFCGIILSNYESFTMLNSEQLMETWADDCRIDQTKLMSVMYAHPILHSKYLTHLQTYKIQLRKHAMKYAKLKSTKIRYFNGELTKEELAERDWQQYLFKKPLRSEMESLLDADTSLQELQEQSLYIETLVQSCESILKDISNRYFLFTNMVAYEKFQSGA